MEREANEEERARFAAEYRSAVTAFVSEGGEKWLQRAHDLGREAIRLGIGLLDVVAIHAVAVPETGCEAGRDFLMEALAPFEMTHRGFAEANSELQELNDSLQRLVDERTEDLRDRQRLSEALNEINDTMRSRQGSERMLSDVLARGAEAIGAESGSVAVEDRGDWVVRYIWGHKPDLVGRRFTNELNPWTKCAIDTGKPVVAEDAQWTSRIAHRPREGEDRGSTIAAPVVVRGLTVAVLHFNLGAGAREFSRGDVDFVEKLSTSLSLALRDLLSFEAEHRIAEVLQEAMMQTPAAIEGVEVAVRYASSTENARVGGDFYDVFLLDPEHVYVAIGDVSGKGIGAASIAAMTKNTIRVHAVPGRPPSEVLRLTNESMHRFTQPDLFVTVLLALLDLATGEVVYASAGHPPAIVLKGSGERGLLEMEGALGPLLAAFTGMDYCHRSYTLEHGDVLVLYTDGVIETRCRGELLGEEGFRDLLRSEPDEADPGALLDRALDDVRACSGGALTDDIALLALRFEGIG